MEDANKYGIYSDFAKFDWNTDGGIWSRKFEYGGVERTIRIEGLSKTSFSVAINATTYYGQERETLESAKRLAWDLLMEQLDEATGPLPPTDLDSSRDL